MRIASTDRSKKRPPIPTDHQAVQNAASGHDHAVHAVHLFWSDDGPLWTDLSRIGRLELAGWERRGGYATDEDGRAMTAYFDGFYQGPDDEGVYPTFALGELVMEPDASGVCRIGGTRVSLESLAAAYYDCTSDGGLPVMKGGSIEDLATSFPDLSPSDIRALAAYLDLFRESVRNYLWHRDREAGQRQHSDRDRVES